MTTLAGLKTTLREIITQQSGYSKFNDDDLFSTVGVDSLTTIEIVMAIEDQFEISIELADIGKGRFTLNTLCTIVASKMGINASE